ncbi:hypothetical protein P7K49_033147 [Saguinus oedipus]|uniref:Uncharacterized protein n=1 Tax=Saguinus oedipus TaxID=9490 RepID=A0ABQ9TRU2_SAGOE|nr:hypothetical protein P7K49_033147 [Saguinus oedipus]
MWHFEDTRREATHWLIYFGAQPQPGPSCAKRFHRKSDTKKPKFTQADGCTEPDGSDFAGTHRSPTGLPLLSHKRKTALYPELQPVLAQPSARPYLAWSPAPLNPNPGPRGDREGMQAPVSQFYCKLRL